MTVQHSERSDVSPLASGTSSRWGVGRAPRRKRRGGRLRRRWLLPALLVALGMGLPAGAQPAYPSFLDPAVVAEPTEMQTRADALEGAIEEKEASLAGLSTEVEQLVQQRGNVRDSLRRRIRALYRMRRAGMLPVAGGFDAMLGHLGRMERLERMVREDLRSAAFLDRRASALEGKKGDEQRALQTHRRELESVRERIAQQPTAAGSLPYEALYDPSADRLPVGIPSGSGGYGMIVRNAAPASFSSLRGRLRLPVAAGGTMRDGRREDGAGLEFEAPAGARVEAVAEGTVAFARRYGVYGPMVVIDHGGEYFTVYAGLDRLEVTVGEPVVDGQTLGALGGSPLYFEVRRGTRSLNPHEWVGI